MTGLSTPTRYENTYSQRRYCKYGDLETARYVKRLRVCITTPYESKPRDIYTISPPILPYLAIIPNMSTHSTPSPSYPTSRSASISSIYSTSSSSSHTPTQSSSWSYPSSTSSTTTATPTASTRRPSIQLQGLNMRPQEVACSQREAQLYFLMGFRVSGGGNGVGGLG
jgi:hypothetical protein